MEFRNWTFLLTLGNVMNGAIRLWTVDKRKESSAIAGTLPPLQSLESAASWWQVTCTEQWDPETWFTKTGFSNVNDGTSARKSPDYLFISRGIFAQPLTFVRVSIPVGTGRIVSAINGRKKKKWVENRLVVDRLIHYGNLIICFGFESSNWCRNETV